MSNQTELNVKASLKAAMFVVLFFLCSGSITVYYLYKINIVHTIYRYLSFGTIFLLVLYYILRDQQMLSRSFFWGFCAFFVALFVATASTGGALKTLFRAFATPIGMFLLFGRVKNDESIKKIFVRYLSNVFLLLELVNLVCIFVTGGFFRSNWYFLGIENHIGFSLAIFVVFFLIDYHYNKNQIKFFISIIVYITTVIKIWSGSAVVAMFIMVAFIVLPFIRKIFSKTNYTFSIFVIGCALLFLVFYSFSATNNDGIVAMLVRTILKKDATFSGRTHIWKGLIESVAKKPLFGYGITGNSNVFKVGNSILSAHNTFFEILYKGGIASIASLLFMGLVVSKNIARIQDKKLASILKICLFALSIELMGEAMFIDCLFTFFYIALLFSPKQGKFIVNKKTDAPIEAGVHVESAPQVETQQTL